MRCLQCGKKLSLLRKIANGEFCTAEHRDLYLKGESQLALARLQESQVRIERPAAMAAVERLRAMDSSDSDPVFVETSLIPEGVHPLNQRRMSAPAVGPLDVAWMAMLPERPAYSAALTFASSDILRGVVEPGPQARPAVARTLALRPLFRLGIRLAASGVLQRAGRIRRLGLISLTLPRPMLRPGRIRNLPTAAVRAIPPGGAQPLLPAFVSNTPLLQLGMPVAQRPCSPEAGSLPLGAAISQPPAAMNVDLHALPPIDQTPGETPLRAATRAAKIRALGLFAEPAPQLVREPALSESMMPVALQMASGGETRLQAPILALPSQFTPVAPVCRLHLAVAPSLRPAEEQESVGLRAAARPTAGSPIADPAGAKALPELPGALPELPEWMRIPAVAMREDTAMQPVMLPVAAVVRSVREIAATSAAEPMDPAFPESGTPNGFAPVLRSGVSLLAVGEPGAEAGRIATLCGTSALDASLEPALPAHESAYTTLPRMREEAGMQPLRFAVNPAQSPALAETRPLAMGAAAAAGGPVLPVLTAHPEPLAAESRAKPVSHPVTSAMVPEIAEAEGESVPPALDRPLPLAVGRALRESGQPPVAPVDSQSAIWDVSMAAAPNEPALRLTIDHADGSGSRQGRIATSKNRLGRFPSIDMRSLPGRRFWKYAPADLKWVALGLPLILVFVVYSFRGTQPKTEAGPVVAAPQAAQPAIPASNVPVSNAPASNEGSFTDSLKQVLMNRAAVNLLDDFRGGLGAWQGSEGWAKSWHYGQATFLEPGSLAFYKPSMALRDYSLEFLGQIQGRSLNWVFRAKDARNYYAMRIVVTRPGLMPDAQIVQYAVINGKEERPKVMPTPYPIRPDTMYLVRVDVRGNDFRVYLQGQPIYNFTDDRLQEGGIGFFSPKGDKSYLRWVQVKHQYDYIGRLCALLAPYHVPPETTKSE